MKSYPGVSIIKPLLGVNPCLKENLISHFELDYPQFEILLCIECHDDPVLDLVKSLIEKYSHVDVRLFIGGNGSIMNPIINNVLPGIEAAKYNLIWHSNAQIRVRKEIMYDLVYKANDPAVGLVHQVPFCVDHEGFASAIEKVSFGCILGRRYIAINHIGFYFMTGMSYMYKKSILNKLGGLHSFGDYLAEDYFISRHFFKSGYKVIMSDYPAEQNAGVYGISAYMNRMVRWYRLRINLLSFTAIVCEPLIECFNSGLFISWSLNYLFKTNMIAVFLIYVSVWALLDYTLLKNFQNGALPFSFPTFVLAWVVREFVAYFVYFKALMKPKSVIWSARNYRLYFGGRAELLQDPSSSTMKQPPQTEADCKVYGQELICTSLHGYSNANLSQKYRLESVKSRCL